MAQITIVICASENEKTIGSVIESAMAQSFSDVDILVVDDASTDMTFDIAQAFARQNSRIAAFKHIKKQGISAVRKTGLRISRSPRVLFWPASKTMDSTMAEMAALSVSGKASVWANCTGSHESSTEQKCNGDVSTPSLIELIDDYCNCDDEERLPLAIARLSSCCPTFFEIQRLLKHIHIADFPSVSNRPNSISQYYYRIGNGGVERVMTELSALFLSSGKRSTVFTGCSSDEDSYPLDNGVHLEVLAESLGEYPDPSTVLLRLKKMRACFRELSIDAYICHQWISPQSVWDLLLCKALGIRFILMTHGVFSFSLAALPSETHFWTLPYIVALCDAVVCLSDSNRYYYSKFNSNTFVLPNPITKDLRTWLDSSPKDCRLGELKTVQRQPTILWLGRFEHGKHPGDAIDIMKCVLDVFPNAKLLMVGKSEDGIYETLLKHEAEQSNIADSIEFCGYSKNVREYYERADIFLFTSEMEGSPMVLIEAAATGTPVVMYDLPYLATARCRDWIEMIPMGDIKTAASHIVDIISDPEKARNMSIAANNYAKSLARFDYINAWDAVLTCPARAENVFETDSSEGVFWGTIIEHGAKRDSIQKESLDAMRHSAESANAIHQEYQTSISWKIGRLITALPRRILGNN